MFFQTDFYLLVCHLIMLKEHMNDRQVCAYDKKCGELQTFESVDLAVLNNFTVAHCGPCGACSNWHDFPYQLVSC